jgi:hypothetical protein
MCLPTGRDGVFELLFRKHAQLVGVPLELTGFDVALQGGHGQFECKIRTIANETLNVLPCKPPQSEIMVWIERDADWWVVKMAVFPPEGGRKHK